MTDFRYVGQGHETGKIYGMELTKSEIVNKNFV
jgi:hypothetical protein